MDDTLERTVWHPRYDEDDPDRYRNIPTTRQEREEHDLYYDRYGMLREKRGGNDGSKEWGAEVSRCAFGPDSCGRLWTDPREAHCPICHRQFGGDRAHEMHLEGLSCRDPAGVKHLVLVQRAYGPTWVRGDHLDNATRYEAS